MFSCRNYSLAALISTLAFAYASVPFYKMVGRTLLFVVRGHAS